MRRPRVRLVVTGNELLPTGIAAARLLASPTRTARCWRRLRSAMARSVDFLAWSATNRGAILEALRADADVVIVSGGSSVGIEDLAPVLVAEHGELAVHGIAMRPEQPDRAWDASAAGWCSCSPAIRSRASAPTTSLPAGRFARLGGRTTGVAVPR